MSDDLPITEDWLREVGFKWHTIERSPNKHWLLWCGALESNSFQSFEDLGVELMLDQDLDKQPIFYCWLRGDYSSRYSRFIHIRQMRHQRELIRLLEAITGQDWNPENHWYGSMRRPEEAAYLRKQSERLDLRLMRESHPWREIEKDNSRGRPLPEHQEKAENPKGEQ